MKKLLLFLLLLFSFSLNVKAASVCTYQEQVDLNQKAANVKMSYEVVEEEDNSEDFPIYSTFFKISLFNINEDVYVILKNDYDNKEVRFDLKDTTDGIATFNWEQDEVVTNFTMEVYSSNKTNCPNEIYKTQYMTTPRFNKYYHRESCHEYVDFYLCQRYITTDDVSESVFLDQLANYKKGLIDDNGKETPIEENPGVTDSVFEFIGNYKWVILGIVVIAGAGTGTVIILNKRKKQRDLGL